MVNELRRFAGVISAANKSYTKRVFSL